MLIPGDELAYILFILASTIQEWDNEEKLYRSIKEGDHKAFEEFYNTHYDSLYRFLVSRGASDDQAKDLIQKAFLRIWDSRNKIDESKSLKAYLFRIGYTRLLNLHEYRKKFEDEAEVPDDIESENPEEKVQYNQIMDRVRMAIDNMPDKRKMVFELCFMKQFTYKETSDALGVSVKTVETHMTLAFKDVRAVISELVNMEN